MTQTHFLSLVLPLQDRMFRLAYSFLRDEEDAKDVVQDALVKIWEKRKALTAVDNVEAWCMRITKNTLLDRIRYNRYRKTSGSDEHAEDVAAVKAEEEAEVKDSIRSVQKIINRLPERDKFFIHLRDVEGLAYGEIAQIMELSLAEVKIGIFRARQAIRKTLKNLDAYGLQ